MKQINVLGTTYKIIPDVDPKKMASNSGLTRFYEKEIWIIDYEKADYEFDEAVYKEVLRHEILHAFLYESGLNDNALDCNNWARNEEMVDWFAIQSPKIYKIYKDLDIL